MKNDRNKRFTAILLVIVTLILIGCISYITFHKPPFEPVFTGNSDQSAINTGSIDQPEKITDVELEINAPFSTATLSVEEDGSVAYRAKEKNKSEVKDSGQLTGEQMNELRASIDQAKFFDLRENYRNNTAMTDRSEYIIKVKKDSVEHAVICYEVSCVGLKDKIIKLWGKNVTETGV